MMLFYFKGTALVVKLIRRDKQNRKTEERKVENGKKNSFGLLITRLENLWRTLHSLILTSK